MAKKRSNKALWITIIILIVAIVGIGIIMKMKGKGPVSVLTSKVEKRTIIQTVSAIGKIEPETEVKISSQVSGEIIFLGVKEGDTVKNGQLLVRIKPDLIEPQLEQMRASLQATKMDIAARKAEMEKTQKDLERATELRKKEFISKQELDAATAAYQSATSAYKSALARSEQAEASLKQVETSKSHTTIYATMDGIVTALNVETGEKVVGTDMMQGTEIMRIADLNVMNSMVDVDENDVVLIKMGDTARVEIDPFADKKFLGKVIEIGHSAITSSAGTQDQVTNFKVKIRMIDLDSKLRPGMTCNADIETNTKSNVLAVPLQCVTVRDSMMNARPDVSEGNGPQEVKSDQDRLKIKRPPSVVFVLDKGSAKIRKVETGISDNGFIEIKNGLQEGETVISGPFQAVSKTLTDGEKVMVDTVSKRIKWKK